MSCSKRMPVDRSDPRRLAAQVSAWADTLAARAYNQEVVCRRERDGLRFAAWCADRQVFRGENLTSNLVQTYAQSLGPPSVPPCAVQSRLVALRAFCLWLVKCGILQVNPALFVKIPARVSEPRRILSRVQVEHLMSVPNIDTPEGIRDRALMEVLYSTGLRRLEVCRLRLCDLPPGSGVVRVVRGKGGKDRIVPIGTRAAAWVSAYLRKGRPVLVSRGGCVSDGLFLGNHGGTITGPQVYEVLRSALDAIGVRKGGACHLLRHAFATHLLEAGAAVEAIGSMLGHADLRATPTYTRVNAESLKSAIGRMWQGRQGQKYDANLSGQNPHLSG